MPATKIASRNGAAPEKPKRRKSPTPDPISDSLHHPLVIVFAQSRSVGYRSAVLHARLLKDYCEHNDGESGVLHYCPVAKTREEFARAAAIIGCLRSVKSLAVYCNGSPVGDLYGLTHVLTCYLQSQACNDSAAHCHVVYEQHRPYQGCVVSVRLCGAVDDRAPTGPPEVIPRHVFPCAYLYSRFRFQSGHPSEIIDQIQAAGVKHGCHICPQFRPEDFREIAPRVIHADGTVE